jgi:hypothetical protein
MFYLIGGIKLKIIKIILLLLLIDLFKKVNKFIIIMEEEVINFY